jgi:hypothetical protein
MICISDAIGGQLLALHEVRLRVEPALEQVVAGVVRDLEALARLDLLGQELQTRAAQHLDVTAQAVVVHLRRVDLDHVGQFDERQLVVAVHVVVESDLVAPTACACDGSDELVVGLDVLQHFEHHALRRQRRVHVVHEERARQVDEDWMLTGDRVEAEVEQRVHRHGRGRSVTVEFTRRGLAAAAKEQFVGAHFHVAVHDGLAGDQGVGHRRGSCFRGRRKSDSPLSSESRASLKPVDANPEEPARPRRSQTRDWKAFPCGLRAPQRARISSSGRNTTSQS